MLHAKKEEGSAILTNSWWVYIVRCADASLYTGIAKHVNERVEQHNLGLGAKYTRGRGPVELVYAEEIGEHGDALRHEYLIKQMSKSQKMQMIQVHQQQLISG